jgi:hypothetical protein
VYRLDETGIAGQAKNQNQARRAVLGGNCFDRFGLGRFTTDEPLLDLSADLDVLSVLARD